MKLIELPTKYRTYWNAEREILKRGRKVFLERQTHPSQGTCYIIRERIVRYMNNVMCDVEQADDHQPYQKFKTKKQAVDFFEAVEGGKIAL